MSPFYLTCSWGICTVPCRRALHGDRGFRRCLMRSPSRDLCMAPLCRSDSLSPAGLNGRSVLSNSYLLILYEELIFSPRNRVFKCLCSQISQELREITGQACLFRKNHQAQCLVTASRKRAMLYLQAGRLSFQEPGLQCWPTCPVGRDPGCAPPRCTGPSTLRVT